MAERATMTNRTVVITGAAGGIGSALARRFAHAGARVALLDRDAPAATRLAQQIEATGGQASALSCDVTRWDECQAAMRSVRDTDGRIDVLINNAGLTHLSRFAETEMGVFRTLMEVNFFGAVHCTKAALPALVEHGGTVVVISSVAGFSPLAGRSGYAASKHALHGLFESLRCELRASGVRVMMVCPGFTNTAIGRNAIGGDGLPARAPRTTVGKGAEPAQVAAAIYRGVVRGRRLLVLSPIGKASFVLSRLLPAAYARIMTRRLLVENRRTDPADR